MNISGGLLWGLDHNMIRGQVEALFSDHVEAYIPSTTTCPTCGYSDFTRSGLDPTCPTCDGTGKVITWRTASLTCRAVWIDAAKLHPHQGLVAGEIGDVQIQGKLRDRHIYLLVKDTELAYLVYDGKRVRPESVTVNGVEGATSLDVRCFLVAEGQPGAGAEPEQA